MFFTKKPPNHESDRLKKKYPKMEKIKPKDLQSKIHKIIKPLNPKINPPQITMRKNIKPQRNIRTTPQKLLRKKTRKTKKRI
jgi:hypothetical protein